MFMVHSVNEYTFPHMHICALLQEGLHDEDMQYGDGGYGTEGYEVCALYPCVYDYQISMQRT
jgi:hypothetical protein